MDIRERLSGRLSPADIRMVCGYTAGFHNNSRKADLFALVDDADDRVGYNALWVMTHFSPIDSVWLRLKKDELIDRLLTVSHTGKRRLILTLLERMPMSKEDVRTDCLDFCLNRINSNEPYGVRALCMKLAYAQCRWFPELLEELLATLNMLDAGNMSSGLGTARKNILRQINKTAYCGTK